jgi:hypothetical protein
LYISSGRKSRVPRGGWYILTEPRLKGYLKKVPRSLAADVFLDLFDRHVSPVLKLLIQRIELLEGHVFLVATGPVDYVLPLSTISPIHDMYLGEVTDGLLDLKLWLEIDEADERGYVYASEGDGVKIKASGPAIENRLKEHQCS